MNTNNNIEWKMSTVRKLNSEHVNSFSATQNTSKEYVHFSLYIRIVHLFYKILLNIKVMTVSKYENLIYFNFIM